MEIKLEIFFPQVVHVKLGKPRNLDITFTTNIYDQDGNFDISFEGFLLGGRLVGNVNGEVVSQGWRIKLDGTLAGEEFGGKVDGEKTDIDKGYRIKVVLINCIAISLDHLFVSCL